jgi:hypothetical protein
VRKMVDGSEADEGCNIIGDCEMFSGKDMCLVVVDS